MTVTGTSGPPIAPARPAITQAVRRLGWGVADQGISSLSNFALGLFVARSYGASNFGAFTLAFVTYGVVINAARGLATDPLLVRYSGEADERWRRASSSATGTALAVGIAAGLVCLVAGLLLPHSIGPGFVALGIFLPGLALQDSWRLAFFAAGRGASAFVNDLAWTLLLVGTLAVLHVTAQSTAVTCLVAFGATATVAAVLGGFQARLLPRPHSAVAWVRSNLTLSFRYLAENVSSSGASQLRSFILGAVASLAAVGHVRASEILMGPFLVVVMGISQVAVPEAARAFQHGGPRLRRFCLRLGAVQATGAILWGSILLTVFPLGPGPALLKELWMPTSHLIPAITLTVVAASFITAGNAGLRAMGVSRRSLRAQLMTSTIYVTGGALGAVLGGALGTSWGVTAAQSVGALICWNQLRLALADHTREAVPA